MGAALSAAKFAKWTLNKAEPSPDELLDELDLDWTELISRFSRQLDVIAKEGGDRALTSLGVDDSEMFDQVAEDALDFAKERAAELVGRKVAKDGSFIENPNAEWAITSTTRQELRRLVADALTEGWTTADLKRKIEDSYSFSSVRAEMIARTELAAAHVQGNLFGWLRSGQVTAKVWILGSEHDTDDECDDNADDGQVDLEEVFSSGDDGPPAHPNCVCDVVAVLAGEEEE